VLKQGTPLINMEYIFSAQISFIPYILYVYMTVSDTRCYEKSDEPFEQLFVKAFNYRNYRKSANTMQKYLYIYSCSGTFHMLRVNC